MAKIKFQNIDEFFDFVPMILGVAIKNVDPESPAADFYNNISKKMLTQINQYQRENPGFRLKLKIFLNGLESNQITTISILPDKSSNESQESKYLTELWKPIVETAKKYLRS